MPFTRWSVRSTPLPPSFFVLFRSFRLPPAPLPPGTATVAGPFQRALGRKERKSERRRNAVHALERAVHSAPSPFFRPISFLSATSCAVAARDGHGRRPLPASAWPKRTQKRKKEECRSRAGACGPLRSLPSFFVPFRSFRLPPAPLPPGTVAVPGPSRATSTRNHPRRTSGPSSGTRGVPRKHTWQSRPGRPELPRA